MRPRTTTTTAATALALAVFLGGCGSDGEPTDSTSTASGPSSSSADTEEAAMVKDAEQTYREYWKLWNARSSAEKPGNEQKKLMTEEAYNNAVEDAKSAAPTKVVGRDKLQEAAVKTDWSAGGPTATVEVCYEAHRKFVLTENVKDADGKTLKKGTDIRTDPDGKPIKAGKEMGQLVTMKRGREDGSQWQVHSTEVGYDQACTKGEEQK